MFISSTQHLLENGRWNNEKKETYTVKVQDHQVNFPPHDKEEIVHHHEMMVQLRSNARQTIRKVRDDSYKTWC